jgi:hypothetical protein
LTTKSESIAILCAALVAAQKELPTIPKKKTGKVTGQGKNGSYEYSYKYADLPDVKAACDPILHEHGLAVSQFPGADSLTTILLHESGEWIEESMSLHLAKVDPQGHGSAITYARRYAYCAAVGICADEDDDGKRASRGQSRRGSLDNDPGSPEEKGGTTRQSGSDRQAANGPDTGEAAPEALLKVLNTHLMREAAKMAGDEWDSLNTAERRDRKLAFLSACLNRKVESSKEVTKSEARDLCAELAKSA